MNSRKPPLAGKLVFLLSLLSLLVACSGDPGTGPVDVEFNSDSDTCERCRMVMSDPHYSAQIRGGPEGGESRVYRFDDIGCAVIWLDEQPWRDNPAVEIWVNDHRDGEWINAREAWYVEGNKTPMAYGLGARDDPAEGALTFEQARERIYEMERRFNTHSGHQQGF
ncbi:nitrous oxide reductase accessory protein NosL [Thiohalomonas denitrificans]|uniref:NosL protein n=1 Tax=Thiohalomonas denitrificans TaxID=415747 RepID=A0A1G5QSE4_9GAMM|nr:nitrous oxide reductase accessory protein NosL [Thiohalomonas denitrificans]SCZ64662.1 NosL protein [Thiohalomonas denitrificans]